MFFSLPSLPEPWGFSFLITQNPSASGAEQVVRSLGIKDTLGMKQMQLFSLKEDLVVTVGHYKTQGLWGDDSLYSFYKGSPGG